ncbi:MAG: hypothetical protein JWL89_8 [Candidatus Saccharibacteria bacterium]|nr:hypothetical protein [Candidatus Saccharibacteria bacterium]
MEPQRITISVPQQLLARIDATAKKELTSRSDIMRRALLLYCRENSIPAVDTVPKTDVLEDEDFSEILAKYPTVNPNDRQLLKFYRDMEKEGYNL